MKLSLSPDYDHIIKDRIGHFLMNDSQVLEQVHDLINEEDIRIGIEEDMSYHSFVTYISYLLLHMC